MTNKIPARFILPENKIPQQWYNLRADMKEQPDPLLNPGTGKPIQTEELYPTLLRGACKAGNGQHYKVF